MFASTQSASCDSDSRSARTTSRASGRSTFTTTSLPVRVVARWTCARDADASGLSSTSVKSVETDAPNWSEIAARMSSTGTASTLS